MRKQRKSRISTIYPAPEKILLGCIALACAAGLLFFAVRLFQVSLKHSEPTPTPPSEPILLSTVEVIAEFDKVEGSLECSVVYIPERKLGLSVTNNTDMTLTYGAAGTLYHIAEDSTLAEVEIESPENHTLTALLYYLPPGDTRDEFYIPFLTDLPEPGQYRMVFQAGWEGRAHRDFPLAVDFTVP